MGLHSASADSGLYAPRDWRRGAPSKLNISIYVFSDRNRSASYDIGDKPLNRIAVRLLRPDGTTRLERSNINGYANFSMQANGTDADINAANQGYSFTVLPPDDWTVTTQNATQDVNFKLVAGSIAGMGAANPPAVVGLAPPPTVRGQWPKYAGTTLLTLRNGQADQPIKVSKDGGFAATLPADTGPTETWSLDTDNETQKRHRPAQQEWQPGFAPVVLAEPREPHRLREGMRRDILVTFDDTDRSFIEKLPSGYAGLDWDYLLAVDNQHYKGPGYINGLISGSRVAYNSSGHPVTIRTQKPDGRFDFVGGYFSVAWHNAEGETLIARAWRGDKLVAEDRFALSHLTPVYLQANYQDISRLEFETAHYWQFVVDNLHFRVLASD